MLVQSFIKGSKGRNLTSMWTLNFKEQTAKRLRYKDVRDEMKWNRADERKQKNATVKHCRFHPVDGQKQKIHCGACGLLSVYKNIKMNREVKGGGVKRENTEKKWGNNTNEWRAYQCWAVRLIRLEMKNNQPSNAIFHIYQKYQKHQRVILKKKKTWKKMVPYTQTHKRIAAIWSNRSDRR